MGSPSSLPPRAELDRQLNAFEVRLPTLLAGTVESDRAEAFAGEADVILDRSGADDYDHVSWRLQLMAEAAGIATAADRPD